MNLQKESPEVEGLLERLFGAALNDPIQFQRSAVLEEVCEVLELIITDQPVLASLREAMVSAPQSALDAIDVVLCRLETGDVDWHPIEEPVYNRPAPEQVTCIVCKGAKKVLIMGKRVTCGYCRGQGSYSGQRPIPFNAAYRKAA
ncbi:MAG: hypothetical protein AAFV53_11410 [Myxococcota bacterium]